MSLVMVQTPRAIAGSEAVWVRWQIDSRGWLSAAHLVIKTKGEVHPDNLRRGRVLLACARRAPATAVIVPTAARGRTCQRCEQKGRGL